MFRGCCGISMPPPPICTSSLTRGKLEGRKEETTRTRERHGWNRNGEAEAIISVTVRPHAGPEVREELLVLGMTALDEAPAARLR